MVVISAHQNRMTIYNTSGRKAATSEYIVM